MNSDRRIIELQEIANQSASATNTSQSEVEISTQSLEEKEIKEDSQDSDYSNAYHQETMPNLFKMWQKNNIVMTVTGTLGFAGDTLSEPEPFGAYFDINAFALYKFETACVERINKAIRQITDNKQLSVIVDRLNYFLNFYLYFLEDRPGSVEGNKQSDLLLKNALIDLNNTFSKNINVDFKKVFKSIENYFSCDQDDSKKDAAFKLFIDSFVENQEDFVKKFFKDNKSNLQERAEYKALEYRIQSKNLIHSYLTKGNPKDDNKFIKLAKNKKLNYQRQISKYIEESSPHDPFTKWYIEQELNDPKKIEGAALALGAEFAQVITFFQNYCKAYYAQKTSSFSNLLGDKDGRFMTDFITANIALKSMQEVEQYVKDHSSSLAAKVFNELQASRSVMSGP